MVGPNPFIRANTWGGVVFTSPTKTFPFDLPLGDTVTPHCRTRNDGVYGVYRYDNPLAAGGEWEAESNTVFWDAKCGEVLADNKQKCGVLNPYHRCEWFGIPVTEAKAPKNCPAVVVLKQHGGATFSIFQSNSELTVARTDAGGPGWDFSFTVDCCTTTPRTTMAPTAAPTSVAPTAAPISVAPTAAPSNMAPTAAIHVPHCRTRDDGEYGVYRWTNPLATSPWSSKAATDDWDAKCGQQEEMGCEYNGSDPPPSYSWVHRCEWFVPRAAGSNAGYSCIPQAATPPLAPNSYFTEQYGLWVTRCSNFGYSQQSCDSHAYGENHWCVLVVLIQLHEQRVYQIRVV